MPWRSVGAPTGIGAALHGERSTVNGLAVEGQLTGVATLVVRLLALAVPIRGHRGELAGCGSHVNRPGCIISYI
jgi:hypothetical protein